MSDAATAEKRAYMPTKALVEDWTTPEEVLEPVRRVFGGHIDFDPCGNPSSVVQAKRQVWLPKWVDDSVVPGGAPSAGRHHGPLGVIVGDGLSMKAGWIGNVFVNPPYSAEALTAFMERSYDCAAHGDGSVILLTKVKLIKGWHRYVPLAPAVCFINHRLTFGGGGGDSAPFDCALILWSKSRTIVNRFALEMEPVGDVMFHR